MPRQKLKRRLGLAVGGKMARPPKNNCDYFPHDAGMRNHKKVKAIRVKFGMNGYALWSMLLEYLTGSDGNVFPYTDLEFELMSGDFGVSATEIREVVDYCISLEMLFNKGGFVSSESLDERLAPVYEKRGKAKELSKKQLRDNGKYTTGTPVSPVVTVTEMPQSKVKESKGNETKVKESKTLEWFVSQFDEIYVDRLKMAHPGKDIQQAAKEAYAHLAADSQRLYNADGSDCKRLLNTWLSNQKVKPNGQQKLANDIQRGLANIEAKYGNKG